MRSTEADAAFREMDARMNAMRDRSQSLRDQQARDMAALKARSDPPRPQAAAPPPAAVAPRPASPPSPEPYSTYVAASRAPEQPPIVSPYSMYQQGLAQQPQHPPRGPSPELGPSSPYDHVRPYQHPVAPQAFQPYQQQPVPHGYGVPQQQAYYQPQQQHVFQPPSFSHQQGLPPQQQPFQSQGYPYPMQQQQPPPHQPQPAYLSPNQGSYPSLTPPGSPGAPVKVQLLERFAQGSFGEVWRGVTNGRVVACKTFRGEENSAEFDDEVRKLSRLRHFRIVTLVGIAVVEGRKWAVMEMCGMSLQRFLSKLGEFADDVAPAFLRSRKQWCLQVAEGVQYLHTNNVVHADLATRNVLIGPDADAATREFLNSNFRSAPPPDLCLKLTDFGLSRLLNTVQTHQTLQQETPRPLGWSPPEVLHFNRMSPQADIWALGVVMWEIYTLGGVPFARLSQSEILQLLERGERLKRPTEEPRVSDSMWNVMLSTWTERSARPSIGALIQAIAQAQE